MSRARRLRRNKELQLELDSYRAKLHAAHDLLHNNRLNELHDILHCSSCEEASDALSGQNISIGSASRLYEFMPEFNRLCARLQINAACVAFIPSAVRDGFMSIQMGGSVEVIQWVRKQMGMDPTLATGDHD